ncbi:MAG: hypothetical protein JWQ72_2622 [Polaromonas sp.]|nr:hypothetical protein [Polaromonas sp.]
MNHPATATPMFRSPTRHRPNALVLAVVLAVSLLGACRDSADRDPGRSPPAAGSDNPSRPATGSADSTVMRTPAAPDSPGGGSTGFKGVTPLPDSSGGPTSGPRPAGAGPNSAVSGPVSGPGAGQGGSGATTNGGTTAGALANSAGNGNTNSTPNSSAGNAAR